VADTQADCANRTPAMPHEIERQKGKSHHLDKTIEALIHSHNFDEAHQAIRAIDYDLMRMDALGYLARVMAKFGDPRASDVFEEAREVALGVQPASRGYYLRQLASAMAGAKDQRAFEIFEEAHQALIASGISSYYHKAEAFSKLATAMAQAGAPQSTPVFEEAVELGLHVPNAAIRHSSLFSTAMAMVVAGDKPVRQVFDVILQNIVAPDNDFERVWALCGLASTCADYLRCYPS
jgi:hypothetical protein